MDTTSTLGLAVTPHLGVGIGDMQHAMRAEIDRIVKETKGDVLAETKLLLRELGTRDLLQPHEVEAVYRFAELSSEVSSGKRSAQSAYLETRDAYNTMLAGGKASPLALLMASSSVGSYTISANPDGSGTVVIAKASNTDWEHRGAAAGAVIGSIWGPEGALVGGAIGGLIGAAVDHCTK